MISVKVAEESGKVRTGKRLPEFGRCESTFVGKENWGQGIGSTRKRKA